MKDRIVLLRLFGVSLLWGCNYVASAYMLQDFSPIFLSYARLVFTSLFLLSFAAISGSLKKPTKQDLLLLLFAGFFGTLLNQVFYFIGLQNSNVGNAALIVALSPVLTMFLARMFLGETLNAFKLSGAFIALSGIVLIVLFGGKKLGISHGDIYLLIAMSTLSISLLFIRRLTKRMAANDITVMATVIGTILMTPAAIVEAAHGQLHVSAHIGMWLLCIAVAVIGQGLAGFWWTQGISAVGASTSSMFMNIPPFVAIIVAYFVLGDPIRPAQIGGGLLILIGVTLANMKWSPSRSKTTGSAPSSM